MPMYAKVFAQIFDSSIADNYNLRHFFMDLLVLAEVDGVVDMTPEAIAARTRIPLEDVNRYIAELESPDPRSRSAEHEGRRIVRLDTHRNWGWRIVNYNIYRRIASEEQRRYMTKNRVRKHRKSKALQDSQCNAPVTHDNAGNAKQRQKKKQKHIKNTEGDGFKRPSAGELEFHASKIGLPMSQVAEFVKWYDGNGWMVKSDGGKMEKMKSWKGTMAGWKNRWEARRNGETRQKTDDDRAFEMIFGPT